MQIEKNAYIPFEEALEYARSLGLKTQIEWKDYVRSGKLPKNIPSRVDTIYKDDWVSWPHFLGREVVSFEEALEYARSLGFSSIADWFKHSKLGKKPNNIPYDPSITYKDKGWVSWAHFLGYEYENASFEEALEHARSLEFKTQRDWLNYCKLGKRPKNIPSNPNITYKDKGWVSWPHFLGYETVSFEEALTYARSLRFSSHIDWLNYCKSGKRPKNIPFDPNITYKDKGWVSWAHFLGYIGNGSHNWTKQNILHFINSLKDELINLDSIELITIINSNNLSNKIKESGYLNDFISSRGGTKERENLLDSIIKIIEGSEDLYEEETNITNELEEELIEGSTKEVIEDESILNPVDTIQELKLYDNSIISTSLDEENIDFLLKNQLKKLWNNVLNDNVDIEQLKNETGGEKFTLIKNLFFEEYNKVIAIESPKDYIFKHSPNLMQKLITYRLINEKRYGNWSGTGAGKTLSAIFAGRYAGAKNTIVICNNATVEGWTNSINEYFSNNKVYTKKFLEYSSPSTYTVIDKYNVNFEDGYNNYLILNYESFQLQDGEYIVSKLINNNRIDYIILDEVQNVKQRDSEESIRRSVINKLIIHSKEKNEDLLLMAMSATPIINNLTEPKKLIELLTGEAYDELKTADNIINGVEMYKALTRHGLRYKPNYNISVNEEVIEIDGSHLSERIIKIPNSDIVEFERTLVETKLEAVKDKIKKGTLIYTHYVTELIDVIGDYVKDLGFSIGFYTGEVKRGLKLFKEGKIDILIGSSPIATGVDGIQDICNTLIPICLPWTSSEYEQLVGRVNRQGSNFDHVNIYIPQVVINIGDGIWSWDKRRFNIIKFKATLADLAIDGRIPKNLLPSKDKLIEEAKIELYDWVNRIKNDDIITFVRDELMIPINTNLIERSRNKLGDFSELNKRWSVTRSNKTYERLSKDPTEWYYYHTLYSEKRKTWLEIPYKEIANKINARPDWIVGDFGCGENLLSKEIKNKVYAFDYIAIDNSVCACDIMNVPIEDGVLDVVVFSLSLMGANYVDYFKEAYRTLKTYGNIFICEPASKWKGREEQLKIYIEDAGFKCFEAFKNTDKFIYIDGVKY